MRHVLAASAALVSLACAAPAFADGDAGLDARLARAEQQLAAQAEPSTRAIQSSVDAYLASGTADAALVGGPGSAGYDQGFWIRGGTFLLKTNLTIQTRYEYWDWNDRAVEPVPGGDLSGFSLPRVTLKLSGDATCSVHYYAELEFGHPGLLSDNSTSTNTLTRYYFDVNGGFDNHALAGGDVAREAWVEHEASSLFSVRMGLVKLPTTRQLMTPPEMQQFVDVSLASVFVGVHVPGYTDRNRDYGLLLHGAVGCDAQFSYLLSITNGDGPVHRNVIDGTTNDNLAYAARVNWDIKGHMGYEEGALRQSTCGWVASVSAWGYVFDDVLNDNPHTRLATRTLWGFDGAFGWGGLSVTAAYTNTTLDQSDLFPGSQDGWSALVQVGYLIPNTSWEVAARYSTYDETGRQAGLPHFAADEFGVAVNYYLDGHADKLTLDVASVQRHSDGNVLGDVYAGYNAGIRSDPNGNFESDGMLLRFQWQLVL